MTNRSSFAPFQLVEVEPNGSFQTTLLADPWPEEPPSGRHYEVRPGDGFLRRDGSLGATFEVWAVEDGQEWCVDADIHGIREAQRRARTWQRGYEEALSG